MGHQCSVFFKRPLLPSVFYSSLLSLKNQIVNVELPSLYFHRFSISVRYFQSFFVKSFCSKYIERTQKALG